MKGSLKGFAAAGVVAVVALLIVSVASSSAAINCEQHVKVGTGKYRLCVEKGEVGSPTQPAVPVSMQTKPGSIATFNLPKEFGTVIECSSVSGPGNFDTSLGKLEAAKNVGLNQYRPTFKGCQLHGLLESKCKVSTEFTFEGESGVIGSTVESVSMQSEGSVVGSFTLSNNGANTCPSGYAGKRLLVGVYECKLPEDSKEQVEHVMSCAGELAFQTAPEVRFPISYAVNVSLAEGLKGKTFSLFEHQ
jgi:hypothetical protein